MRNKKILVFDTNIWISLISNSNKYNKEYLNILKKQYEFGIFNMSLIEFFMRFKREKKIFKIKEIIKYIHNNNIYVGKIECPNFEINVDNFYFLISKSDEELIKEIDKLQNERIRFKSSVISLWIQNIIELLYIAILEDKSNEKDIENIFMMSNNQLKSIYNKLFEYFNNLENEEKVRSKNILDIVNKIYKEIFYSIDIKKLNYNEKVYNNIKLQIENLTEIQSVSYIYKGIYKNDFMNLYINRINKSLKRIFNNEIFSKIYLMRLESFMQGEPLQRNDVEDMLMLSTKELDVYNRMIIVTKDKKMKSFLKKINENDGEEIYKKLFSE